MADAAQSERVASRDFALINRNLFHIPYCISIVFIPQSLFLMSTSPPLSPSAVINAKLILKKSKMAAKAKKAGKKTASKTLSKATAEHQKSQDMEDADSDKENGEKEVVR